MIFAKYVSSFTINGAKFQTNSCRASFGLGRHCRRYYHYRVRKNGNPIVIKPITKSFKGNASLGCFCFFILQSTQFFNTDCEYNAINEKTLLEDQLVEYKSPLVKFLESLLSESTLLFYKLCVLFKYTKRLLTYFIYGAPLCLLIPINKMVGDTSLEEYTWGYLKFALVKLGPCFIKIAQWASSRPDLFPRKLTGKLISLQDDVDIPCSYDATRATLTHAFGNNWEENIEIEQPPIGAGSIAQVYKAKIKDTGEDVVVKIVHPHVEDLINVDMAILSSVTSFVDSFRSLEMLSLGKL